jgi:acetylornithine/N-succinyldiaminopimelate aminotransferase
MVLAGRVNKRIVSALSSENVDAIGLSGIDRGAVKAEKLEHPNGDLGWVGRVVSVRREVFSQLLEDGVTAVLSPVCWGSSGEVFNVNADHVAAAVATALDADVLVFVSNVPGLLVEGRPVPLLRPSMVDALIADGAVSGGMIPKVRSAVAALDAGVQAVRITDLEGLGQGTGTTLVPDDANVEAGDFLMTLKARSEDPEAILLEQQYVLQTYRRPPFVLESGKGAWLYDSEGRSYLDGVSGIAVNVLGHSDAEVVEALKRGSEGLIHVSNLYHTSPHAQLARSLVERSFADRVFFCNSGTEAVEAALKFARKHALQQHGKGKSDLVAFRGSFHGRTMGALSVTSTEKYREPFAPLVPGVRFLPFNDVDALQKGITDDVSAVIVEPVQGEGGVHPATPEFLNALRRACDEHGALLIFDEVQCGLGRTGSLWAYEHYGVTPDLMTLAKPLAAGLPMGAVLMTQAVADSLEPGDHGSTFAAGPLISQIARVVLDRVSSPEFLAKTREKGEHLEERLRELGKETSLVKEVRGVGLMWGIEVVGEAAQVISAGYGHGIILCGAGPNVVRVLPPLVITHEEIDLLADGLLAALKETERGMEP